MLRKDRVDGGKGGLITLIKDSLRHTELSSPENAECITVNIKTENSFITASNVYILPDQNVDFSQLAKLFTPKSV